MFWRSIVEGFAILGHWQVWLAVAAYIALNWAFLFVTGALLGDEENPRLRLGCLLGAVGRPLFGGALMAVIMAFILPILLGAPSAASISMIWALFWPIIKTGLIAICAVAVLCFVPVIGAFIAESVGLQTFLLGLIIFRLLTGPFIDLMCTEMAIKAQSVAVYPGFWPSVAFLVVGVTVVTAVKWGIAFTFVAFESKFPRLTSSLECVASLVVMPLLIPLAGMIPVFMYASYTRFSIVRFLEM